MNPNTLPLDSWAVIKRNRYMVVRGYLAETGEDWGRYEDRRAALSAAIYMNEGEGL